MRIQRESQRGAALVVSLITVMVVASLGAGLIQLQTILDKKHAFSLEKNVEREQHSGKGTIVSLSGVYGGKTGKKERARKATSGTCQNGDRGQKVHHADKKRISRFLFGFSLF